jgi:DNA repair exonuclease SbcCD ATPase subunit
MVFPLLFAAVLCRADTGHHHISPFKPHITYRDHVGISVEGGDVVIYDKDDDERIVEITNDNRLFVNDRFVKTDETQQALTEEYRDRVVRVRREIKRIAAEGAKIGIDGAAIGVKAVVGVFKLILPDYDTEDLDRDMDRATEKIEAKAEKLEERANRLDSSVVELEELHRHMKEEIPALRELEWF